MRRPKIFLFLLVSLVFFLSLPGCWLGARPVADWTFLVYMAADNDLDDYATLDLKEMTAVGSTPRLQIVVQHDPFSRGVPTRRYRVAKDYLVELARLGETNTGDKTVLEDFLVWGMRNFPARHFALVIWDHGSGVFDGFPPGGSGTKGGLTGPQAVAVDRTAGDDALTTREYAGALGRAVATAGKRLDLLCFDACYMQMAEVAAEIAAGEGGPLVDYLVGSEAAVPGEGLDYKAVLSWLAGHPGAEPAALASFLVDNYAATYASSWSAGVISCALYLTGEKWPLFLATCGQLATAIATGDEGLRACAAEAAQEACFFVDYWYPANRDLLDFVRLLGEKAAASYPTVAQIAGELQTLLLPGGGLVVRAAATGPLAEKGLGGLAVFLPTSSAWLADYPDYFQLRFAALTGWDKAVAAVAGQ
ncbi:MAG: clostripain-related cysteine peptidase [Bacillota bacterium]